MTSVLADQRATEAGPKKVLSDNPAYSSKGIISLAVVALLTLLGAGLLLSFAFGRSGRTEDVLAVALFLSPALLPCCAIVALVKGRVVLSKVLLGFGVLGTAGLAVGSMGIAFLACYTDASTPVPGCVTAQPRGFGAMYVFGFATVCGIVTLCIPFRRHA